MEKQKSKGHIEFIGNWEFFELESGDVYKADTRYTYLDYQGYRTGGRFVTTAPMKAYALQQAREWLSKFGE